MEQSQTHQTHGNLMFNYIPFIPFQSLQWACPPIAPTTSLLCTLPTLMWLVWPKSHVETLWMNITLLLHTSYTFIALCIWKTPRMVTTQVTQVSAMAVRNDMAKRRLLRRHPQETLSALSHWPHSKVTIEYGNWTFKWGVSSVCSRNFRKFHRNVASS